MKIYYWSPFTSKVATIKAVINSAYSMKKFYNHKTYIINVYGEWDEYINDLKKKNIKVINNKSKIKSKFRDGFLLSRFLYIRIFLNSFFFLKKIISKEKPDFLVIHLITSLPILLFNLFNFKTKLILRISGYPRLNFIRKYFWKFSNKNIFKVTTPTKQTQKNIFDLEIFDKKKIHYLPDPVFLKKDLQKKYSNSFFKKRYILNIGRLSKQKNQKLLINSFAEISRKYPNINLFILGNGELEFELKSLAKQHHLEKKIFFKNHSKDPYKFIKKSICVIVSSLWEDPGFVMIEASALKKNIICSNCPNGPKEFFKNGKNNLLFENDNLKSLISTFEKLMTIKKVDQKKILQTNFKQSLNFSDQGHSKKFEYILNVSR